jgi:hypothetical protein
MTGFLSQGIKQPSLCQLSLQIIISDINISLEKISGFKLFLSVAPCHEDK